MTVFPANHINRFIDYKSMISEEKSKYLFIIAEIIAQTKTTSTGGVFQTLSQKQT